MVEAQTTTEETVPYLLRFGARGHESAVRLCHQTSSGVEGLRLHLRSGHLVDIIAENPPTILDAAVLAAASLSDRDKKKLQKQARAEQRGEVRYSEEVWRAD